MSKNTNPNEFCMVISGCLCLSEKKENKSLLEFTSSYLRGVNVVINNKLKELRRASYRRPFVIKTEDIIYNYNWRTDESFAEFKKRIRPEIFENIKQSIQLWWQQFERTIPEQRFKDLLQTPPEWFME
jgi:hypothetical protein